MPVSIASDISKSIAKFALKELSKGAGKQTAKYLILEILFDGGGSSRKLTEISEKLDILEKGQLDLKQQISALHERVGLKTAVEDIHNQVHGVLLVLKSNQPTEKEIKRLNDFTSLSGSKSAVFLADNLHQKLFGSGELIPDSFWLGTQKNSEPLVPARDSHVAMTSRDIFTQGRNNTIPLDEYIPKMFNLYKGILNYFGVLGAALILADEYLKRTGQSAKTQHTERRDNSALYVIPGLAGMIAERAMEYIVAIAPEAFAMYNRVFLEKQSLAVGFNTKSRNKVVEWDLSSDRRPVEQNGGMISSVTYRGLKPIYADHEYSGSSSTINPHHWWRMILSSGDGPHYCVALQANENKSKEEDKDEGKKTYLGRFKFKAWGRASSKFGPLATYTDEIALGGDRGLGVCRWRVHLRRDDGNGELYFMLENLDASKFLNVNGENSVEKRQIFLEGGADTHDDKAFKVRFRS